MSKDKWFKQGIELSEVHINELVNMLTKRCKDRTKKRIRSLITYDLDTLIEKHWGLKRFYISLVDKDVHYCVGQCYTSELKTIRTDLMRMFP